MLKKPSLCSIFLSALLLFELSASADTNTPSQNDQSECVDCGRGPKPMRITVRNIGPKGIGYRKGYTTFEGFFAASEPWKNNWVPYLDVRGHVFNDGKPAANVGIGARYLRGSRIWGANGYYDYRKTSRKSYNQLALGIESLGQVLDYRVNGYFPVGDKVSRFYDKEFERFEKNFMIISGKRQFAMSGFNAEAGAHWELKKNIPLYVAAGPYYLKGHGEATWGGQFRFVADLLEYARIEGNFSYDHEFRWIGQAQASLIFPFGCRTKVKARNKDCCAMQCALSNRLYQRVDRFEIIALDRKRKKEKAINPKTDEPFVFWFVDNTSHSNGTFESPFNTLAAAQNASSPSDVIYVFPGDGTTTGMNQGITLKNNQKLFGAGISQFIITKQGPFTIPAMASSLPKITNSLNPAITCGSNNEISGIHVIANAITGILCSGKENTFIHNNTIDVHSTGHHSPPNGIGLILENNFGNISVTNNVFNQDATRNFAVFLASTGHGTDYSFINNQFLGQVVSNGSNDTGIEFGTGPNQPNGPIPVQNFNSISILNNLFRGHGTTGSADGHAIGGFGLAGSGKVVIRKNTFDHEAGFEQVVHIPINSNPGQQITIDVSKNIWKNSLNTSRTSLAIITNDPTSSVCVNLIGNTSDAHPGFGGGAYVLNNSAGGNFSATPASDTAHNTGTVNKIGLITTGFCGTIFDPDNVD